MNDDIPKSLRSATPPRSSAGSARQQVYHVEYDGYYTMSRHDDEANELRRWFDNFKVGRFDSFASETEMLIVEEVESSSRRRGKRYVCTIEDEGRGTKRQVAMDHTAPKPPLMTFAAKRKYVPPPPRTAREQRIDAKMQEMHYMGYQPIRRRRKEIEPNWPIMPVYSRDPIALREMMMETRYYSEPRRDPRARPSDITTDDYEEGYEIVWEKVDYRRYDIRPSDVKVSAPPAPKHRRNA